MMMPSVEAILEARLMCNGFAEANTLAAKINSFFKLVREKV